MAPKIMDGREVSRRLRPELEHYARELRERQHRAPALAAVLVGDDPASRQYVRNKRRFAEDLGFESRMVTMTAEEASPSACWKKLRSSTPTRRRPVSCCNCRYRRRSTVFKLFDAIDPSKDVDAVGAVNVSDFYRAQLGRFIPCTPRGVLTLLKYYAVPTDGARVAVIGRSDIAGKPMALIMGGRMCNATVTWCHRHTRDLPAICREADIVVSCAGADTGRPFLITAEMIKPGACVIDVGFRRMGPGKFVGRRRFRSGQGSRRMGDAQSRRHRADDGAGADAEPDRCRALQSGPATRDLLVRFRSQFKGLTARLVRS